MAIQGLNWSIAIKGKHILTNNISDKNITSSKQMPTDISKKNVQFNSLSYLLLR
jgi:hypothetical protein